ncbi:MAG: hypothetical protein WC442_03220 [Candidatus Omnitrophota bacterium]
MKYFYREYKRDLFITLFAILSTVTSFLLKPKMQFSLSLIIIFVSLIIIIYFRVKEKDFYFISFKKRENKDDWTGKGYFDYLRTERCFLISDSDSGYIYSKSLTWSDYRVSFEFKIFRDCLGIILRAVNLSNYAMLQIKTYGIRPHVRVNGGWFVLEAKDVNLSFKDELSLDKWYKCFLSCEKGSINIKIFDKKDKLFDRNWDIPQGNLYFDFKKDENDSNSIKIAFPINLEYGSVGFRNAGTEKALVQSLLIERI